MAGGSLLGLLVLLSLPASEPPLPALPRAREFSWNQDELWSTLETSFAARPACPAEGDSAWLAVDAALEAVQSAEPPPEHADWERLEKSFFELSSLLGACPGQLNALLARREEIRSTVKRQSSGWGVSDSAQDRLYRLLYGTRAALEELLLRVPAGIRPGSSVLPSDESPLPSLRLHGVTVRSGDILLSRGGAPTSAFIARGNSHPGNFSHVALLHIDDATREPHIIEAHIERGVAVSSIDEYLTDKKLRIMVLRLVERHPALEKDALLPHRVATRALEEVRERHIPYDFAMDFAEPSAQFCSEVVSTNYAAFGVKLWKFRSSFTRPGLARWMHALGVEHFETYGPSDLEYDPQLMVVAEWFDPGALLEAHVENAIIDAMLTEADSGATFDYEALLLPLARLTKGYSLLLNSLGEVGPVPEGMSATVALRAEWLRKTHDRRKEQLLSRARKFQRAQGYFPPYWRLSELALETR